MLNARGRTCTFALIALQATPFATLALSHIGAGTFTPPFLSHIVSPLMLAVQEGVVETPLADWQSAVIPLDHSCLMVRLEGVEPSHSGWKPDILPLRPQPHIEPRIRFERMNSKSQAWRI